MLGTIIAGGAAFRYLAVFELCEQCRREGRHTVTGWVRIREGQIVERVCVACIARSTPIDVFQLRAIEQTVLQTKCDTPSD